MAKSLPKSTAVINMSAPVFIGTEDRIVSLVRRLATVAIVNMDSPNFIVLAKEPSDRQLAKAIMTTTGRKSALS